MDFVFKKTHEFFSYLPFWHLFMNILIQWGFGKTARTFTLPISTQWSKVVAFHNGESPDTVSVKTDVVQSTFTVKTLSGAVDAHYISIGK
jgi:hypothetical protein